MKDFFDLRVLARQADFNGDILTQAIRATFDRRATPLPNGVPFGFTESFAQDRQKQTQWQAFLNKNALDPVPLTDVLDLLRGFLLPSLRAVPTDVPLSVQWSPWSAHGVAAFRAKTSPVNATSDRPAVRSPMHAGPRAHSTVAQNFGK